jgi:3-hydroxyisobutyrate dehydrogenase-like beta-hydroxyacid dehydrogenase
MKIGLVGLGRMGRAIQSRLADQGVDVIGWDRDAVAMQRAAERGMTIAAHPRAVADAADGTVISIITEDGGVRSIFRGKDGFLTGEKGKLLIEMSTLQPMTGRVSCYRRPAAG